MRAGTYSVNVAGAFVAVSYDLVSRDLVQVVSMTSILRRVSVGSAQAGAAGAQRRREHHMLEQQIPKKLSGDSGGKAKVEVDFTKKEE